MPKPKTSISLHVDREYTIGFMVRTMQGRDGSQILHALSRKTGRWIQVTAEQVKENDVPRDCLFLVDELPGADSKP